MAELDFSHNVQQIPAGESLPNPIQRKEHVETQPIPDIQGAVSNYAASSNWMSSLGSYVATKASNQIATQLGAERGKDPHGDIGIPLTEFDEVMQKSYQTQAQATLGLQANKLISDANLEAATASRVTPDLIANTNKKISLGLQTILKNAPSEIRPGLEHQYGSQQISQANELGKRMVSEQRQDRKDNSDYAAQTNATQAQTFAKDGNFKAGLLAVENTKKIMNSDHAANIRSKVDAEKRIETAQVSFETGKTIHDYEKARAEKREPAFMQDIADGSYKINDKNREAVISNFLHYVSYQNNLRTEYEQLKMTQFDTALHVDPTSFETNNLLSEIENFRSPLDYAKARLKQATALKAYNEDQAESNVLTGGWSNPEIMSRTSDKAKDKKFDDKVRNLMENASRSGKPVSLNEAESVVAAQASGPVKRFIATVNGKLSSTDPTSIQEGIRQLQYMHDVNKGSNLQGVTDDAKSMAAIFPKLLRSNPPEEAALKAHEQIYNQSDSEKTILKDRLDTLKKDVIKPAGPVNYFAKLANFSVGEITDPIGFEEQAQALFDNNFNITHGDVAQSQDMLIRDLHENYGYTFSNGYKQISYLPLEKTLDLPTNDVVEVNKSLIQFKDNKTLQQQAFPKVYSAAGIIQEDIIEQVGSKLEKANNELYKWELEPRASVEHAVKNKNNYDAAIQREDNLTKYANGSPIVIHKVWKNGTRETYYLNVKASPYLSQLNNGSEFTGGWDVVLAKPNSSGYENLSMMNQNLQQHIYYRPDGAKLKAKYLKHFGALND